MIFTWQWHSFQLTLIQQEQIWALSWYHAMKTWLRDPLIITHNLILDYAYLYSYIVYEFWNFESWAQEVISAVDECLSYVPDGRDSRLQCLASILEKSSIDSSDRIGPWAAQVFCQNEILVIAYKLQPFSTQRPWGWGCRARSSDSENWEDMWSAQEAAAPGRSP
jgi:hypothetical protein